MSDTLWNQDSEDSPQSTVAAKWKTVAIVALAIIGIYLFYTLGQAASSSVGSSEGEKIAKIPLNGMISSSSGSYGTSTIQPSEIRSSISQAKNDDVAGYLFTINSQGGSIVATKELGNLIASIDRPTVCQMRDIAASGAVWAATECDQIVADSLTLTGSIGVKRTYLELSDLLNEYGIEYVNLTAGKYKDAGTPYANLTDEERSMLQEQLNTAHEAFKQHIADKRNLSQDTIDQISEGQILLGKEASEAGLVDHLGSRETAMNLLENMTGNNLTTKQYSPSSDFSILSLLAKNIGEGIGYAITATARQSKGLTAVRDTTPLQ